MITLQPCVKFAWDVYDVLQFPAYMAVWRDLIAQFTAHPELPEDYMSVQTVVVSELERIATKHGFSTH